MSSRAYLVRRKVPPASHHPQRSACGDRRDLLTKYFGVQHVIDCSTECCASFSCHSGAEASSCHDNRAETILLDLDAPISLRQFYGNTQSF
jgi:hypothetical protein